MDCSPLMIEEAMKYINNKRGKEAAQLEDPDFCKYNTSKNYMFLELEFYFREGEEKDVCKVIVVENQMSLFAHIAYRNQLANPPKKKKHRLAEPTSVILNKDRSDKLYDW